MHIQDFLIKHKQLPAVTQVNCETSAMTTEVKTTLEENDAVVIGPSNPISSIGPILRVNGMKEALKDRFVVAVSPIVGTEPVSGPARKLSLIHISEPTRLGMISYAVFCLKKKKNA